MLFDTEKSFIPKNYFDKTECEHKFRKVIYKLPKNMTTKCEWMRLGEKLFWIGRLAFVSVLIVTEEHSRKQLVFSIDFSQNKNFPRIICNY